jgi:hypothetical protein
VPSGAGSSPGTINPGRAMVDHHAKNSRGTGHRHPPEPDWRIVDKVMLPYLRRWFGWFERARLLPAPLRPVSRVVAAGTGAVLSAGAVGLLTRSRWWKHLPLAVACWALLGKVEGDADELPQDDPPPLAAGPGVREPRRPKPASGRGAAAAEMGPD